MVSQCALSEKSKEDGFQAREHDCETAKSVAKTQCSSIASEYLDVLKQGIKRSISNLKFAENMHHKDHSQKITKNTSAQKKASTLKQVSRSDFLDNVCKLMRRSKECELSETFNPLIIKDLFYQQSKS